MYTFAQPLGRALSIAARSPAVVCQDRRRTYAELGSRCRRLAGAMRALGLARGDRVGVVSLNSDRYLELYLGLPGVADACPVLTIPGDYEDLLGAAAEAPLGEATAEVMRGGRSAGTGIRRLARCAAR